MRADDGVAKTAIAGITGITATAATEQTPLLEGSRDGVLNGGVTVGDVGDEPNADDKPLPVWQIAALCYARWAEPVAFFSIFPYSASLDQWQASRLQLTATFKSIKWPRRTANWPTRTQASTAA